MTKSSPPERKHISWSDRVGPDLIELSGYIVLAVFFIIVFA